MKSILNEDGGLNTILKAFADGKEKFDKPGDANYLGSSISSYSKSLLMSFPVLFDNTLSLDTAMTISKANERNIVTMLQMMFASVDINSNSGKEALAKFHKNINESESIEDIMDSMNAYFESEGVEEVSKAAIREALNEMVYELKKPQKSFPVNSFSETSLSDYTVKNIYGRTVVKEATVSKTGVGDNTNDNVDPKKDRINTVNKNQEVKDAVSLARQQIIDGDFKKANELQPTAMVVNMNTANGRQSFIAGVKCRLIETSAMDIVERIVAKNKSKLSFKNLLRATTGEIHLVSDFLLCIKQAKINAKNAVKTGEAAKLWNTLERRATKNAYNSIKKQSNDATSITTLVINQETANYMKSAFNFDILKVSDAKSIMSEYNLLCIVVADDSVEAAKFLYDGNSSYEVVSYTNLKRDNNEEAYRKALNTMSRR